MDGRLAVVMFARGDDRNSNFDFVRSPGPPAGRGEVAVLLAPPPT